MPAKTCKDENMTVIEVPDMDINIDGMDVCMYN